MEKKELRAQIKALKKQHTKEQLLEQSVKILAKLEQHPDFVKAEKIMLYSALPDEVQTQDFLDKWHLKKTIILPTVVGDDIIPVAYGKDTDGNRIGRGRGYYDRFLCKHLDVKRIGICFDFQLVDEVPTEPLDIRMDEVITL